MLAHNSYPKNTPESQAMRKVFTYTGVLAGLITSCVIAEIVIRSDIEMAKVHQAPEIKTSFVQPKLQGSIFSQKNPVNDPHSKTSMLPPTEN